ncbi:hypothetical protein BH10BDE1_BH10BDE1_22360 [soil metagenome]
MFVTALLATSSAFAQEVAHTATVAGTSTAVGSTIGLAVLGLGVMMGLAVLGGALGQSNAANAALEGIARNPSAAKEIRGSLVLSLALMESLVLFAFLIAILLQGPIGEAIKTVK